MEQVRECASEHTVIMGTRDTARARAPIRDHPGELRLAVRRAPAQDGAASAAWHHVGNSTACSTDGWGRLARRDFRLPSAL